MALPIKQLQRFALDLHDQLHSEVSNRLAAVLAETSAERTESPELVAQIESQISKIGEAALIKQASYTWFNRVVALRFMDVNHYNFVKIVSPSQGDSGLPEVLLKARAGDFEGTGVSSNVILKRVSGLLDGSITSRPGWPVDQEVYRHLLIARCNEFSNSMPYLFEKISAHFALLLPQDLLSPNSFINKAVFALSEEVCESVEVIGWLYQFYISSEKDEAFARIKKGSKAKSSDIPAITQLFTPHYIVKYLAQNSVGRIWLQNKPESDLKGSLDFLAPETEGPDFKKLNSPKELTVLDPAVGSGHLLTYVFDILYQIYVEAGYGQGEIPQLIIQHNLFGFEIDPRAAALASFALAMKAMSFDPQFLTKGVVPNITTLRNIDLTNEKVLTFEPGFREFLEVKGRGEFFSSFASTDSLGSMINFSRDQIIELRNIFEDLNVRNSLISNDLDLFLAQAEILTNRFVCVIANPPYMGFKKMDKPLAEYLTKNFNDSKSDLCIAFIERSLQLTEHSGYAAMITMQSWMHQDSFAKFRRKLLVNRSISNLMHLGPHAFDSIGGEVVSTAAVVISNQNSSPEYHSVFFNLLSGKSEAEKVGLLQTALLEKKHITKNRKYFESFEGLQLFYDLDEKLVEALVPENYCSNFADFTYGLVTGDNDRFIRYWYEVDYSLFRRPDNTLTDDYSNAEWVSLIKGGGARRWYGNHEHVIKWDPSSRSSFAALSGLQNYFKPGGTWSSISNELNVRYLGPGHAIDHAGPAFTPITSKVNSQDLVGLMNSGPIRNLAEILGPGGKKSIGHVSSIPISETVIAMMSEVRQVVLEAIEISKIDWDSTETSWDFQRNPLVSQLHDGHLMIAIEKHVAECERATARLCEIENEISARYADALGLAGTNYPKSSPGNVTLKNNSRWIYKSSTDESRLAKHQLSLVKDLISYAVGCMFGRYSLETQGIVITNPRDELSHLQSGANNPQAFRPDLDNILTVLDDDSFEDDVVSQFRLFMKAAFGEDHYDENIRTVESILGKDIRKYFAKDFYTDHLQRYQNRPIYWMCSSPTGKFKALFYVHRYKPSLFASLRSQYLISYQEKLESRIRTIVETGVGNPDNLRSTLVELTEFDKKVIHSLAIKNTNLDLNDGVLANYSKFGKAMHPIKGMKNDD